MPFSQNGYTVLSPDSSLLKDWQVDPDFTLKLRKDAPGWLLADFAKWYGKNLEPLGSGGDDFGYAFRPIAGTNVWSNHASGTAVDLNSLQHPQGVRRTFTDAEVRKIKRRLTFVYAGTIRWGGTFNTTVDEMHFEIVAMLAVCVATMQAIRALRAAQTAISRARARLRKLRRR